ncbi:hypothetical protein DSECCO2_490390 [anaerobic digester metagenome]
MVAEDPRCRAGAAPEPVDCNGIHAGTGNGRYVLGVVVDGRNLCKDRFFPPGRLLDGVDELGEVLDAVDVVMRRRADRVATLRYHPCPGDVRAHLLAGEVPADARFCSLAEFELDRGAPLQVVDVHAEPPRGDLDDHPVLVGVEAGMQAAFAGAHIGARLLCRPGHREVGVEADCAVAHVAEHDRRLEHEVWSEFRGDLDIAVRFSRKIQPRRFLPEVGPEFDGFAERVGRGRGDLAGVQHQVVEYDREVGDAPHPGEDDLTRPGLVVDRLPDLPRPDRMAPVIAGVLLEHDGVSRAVGEAPVTGGAVPGVDEDAVAVPSEYAVGAVLDASPAFHAPLPVDGDPVPERHAADVAAHGATLPMTGSPAPGLVIDSTPGSMVRIAVSSLAM